MAIITEIQEEEESTMTTYDVFLSFRGVDTRLTFIDHLYQALINENISTFLDEEEVETGDELKPELVRAIKSSCVSIIVLSENYASSTWCLDELVTILHQRRTCNQFVLPIFYHVEPTHVRKQQSTFGEALTIHKRMMEEEKDLERKSQRARKLELWTKGLTEVADLKGKDANGRRETLFIEEIVKEISCRLGLHMRSKVPHLIGMGYSISRINSWLTEKSSKTADILTIWGMAGIGKTSLAEYIFKSNYHKFERSGFLEAIERKCAEQSSALLDLQKKLLGDLLKKSTIIEVRDVDVCTTKLENALHDKRTFVVLDGIDKFEQLDVLIGTKGFHPGSKIIITTKDASIIEKCALFRTSFPPKHTLHKLSCLTFPESLRLFCRHAFGGDVHVPMEGYEEEAERVVKYCGGHPLALKVLGSSLINEDIETWKDTSEMLETKELNTDINKVLRISFDYLPSENCKELFKHIACFFVGEGREVTESILKECGIRTTYGISKLIDRCLLTISLDNKLMMHQLVQEMGRDLVYQESPNKPWKRSRLLNHVECLNMLIKDKGTSKILGLALDMKMLVKDKLHGSRSFQEHKFEEDLHMNFQLIHRFSEFFLRIWCLIVWLFLMCLPSQNKHIELRTNTLERMDKLDLLQLNHIQIKGSYKSFPKGLKWLCMHGFQLKYIPSELPMENLVALDMSYSNLKQFWRKPKLLRSLKILNVSYSNLVRAGGFSGLPSLERLILAGCASLIQVCESISGCDRLVLLDLNYCTKLKQIPRSINRLKKLKILSVNCCIGETMDSIRSIPQGPSSFWNSLPASLVKLVLANNNLSNKSFPKDFSGMSKLTILNLNDNPIHYLPDCVRTLSKLKILTVERCFMLKSILSPPSSLIYLFTEGCLSLEKVAFHQDLSRPPYIQYEGAKSLNEIKGVISFQDLAQVDDEILSALGWTALEYVKDQIVQIDVSPIHYNATKLPVQMCYEFGIFSTYFKGNEVPNWLAYYKSNGSSISFTMPSTPMNKSIQGLNICFVHKSLSEKVVYSTLFIKIWNMTKNHTWIYNRPRPVILNAEEHIVWLSHWMFEKNVLEDGDEVVVTILEYGEYGDLIVKECGISVMYNDGDTEGDDHIDPLGYYKLWKHRIGGNLADFQLTSGDYFLLHPRSITLQCGNEAGYELMQIFQQRPVVSKFIGYTPQYKDLDEREIQIKTHQYFYD